MTRAEHYKSHAEAGTCPGCGRNVRQADGTLPPTCPGCGVINLHLADAHCCECDEVFAWKDGVEMIALPAMQPIRPCPKCAEAMLSAQRGFRLADCT